ncbi:glycosyltransferase family 87 protein [Streptomyces sp. NPDC051997]|uniref:glycosyltransferase family 87 protein n=1 Tax=Streptomyces sp. NPDC051997 TaxID=3155611 RepID=UPI003412C786
MRKGKSDISGWLVRRASWHAWAASVVVLCAHVVGVALRTSDGGMDNAIVVRAARTWLNGGSPYEDRHFLYLPSAVLAAVPQTLLPPDALRVLVPLTVTVLLLVGWLCALRVHGVPGRSRLGVLGPAVLALGFAPFGHLVSLGNWTVTAAAALPLALLLAARERWGWAGVVVGAALALKPLLAPVALLFVFARRRRALFAMVLVPALASGGAALLMPDPAAFVTRTLPFLLRGHDGFVRLYEASPVAVLPRLGVPSPVAVALACVAAGSGVLAAYRRWSRGVPGPLRLVETAVLLMLSAFLVSRPSYDHYLLVVVPLLLPGLPYPASAARGPWFWLALVPQVPGADWPWLEAVTRRSFRDCFTLCVMTASVALWHHRHLPLAGPVRFVAQRRERPATRA